MGLGIVEASDIAGLSDNAFARFVGDLAQVECDRVGIKPSDLSRNVKEKAPDGGIDMRLHAGDPAKAWLPSRPSVWQFKSGDCPSATELAGTKKKGSKPKLGAAKPPGANAKSAKKTPEFLKPGVLEAVARDDMYVFVAADDLTEQKKNEIKKVFRTIHGPSAGIEVLGGSDLAHWASELPSVSAVHLRRFGWLARWRSYRDWANEPALLRPFHPDESRKKLISDVQGAIRQGDRLVFLTGRAGDGKTRAIFEALRDSPFNERTLYLDQQAHLDPSFVSARRMSAILVVDECEDYDGVRKLADRLPPTCVLVAIGHAPSGLGSVRLGGLDENGLSLMLRDRVSTIDEARSRRIVEKCGGSPKLVHFLATKPTTNWERLEHSPGLEEILDEVYPLDGDEEARVMHAVCLFESVGIERPYDGEMEALARWLGVPRDVAWRHVDRLRAKGILSPRGFSVYPTPEILANILARRAHKQHGAVRIRELVEAIPQRAQESLAARLKQIATDDNASEVAEVLFGPKGLFRDASILTNARLGAVARITALAFPESAVRNYELVLAALSDDEVRAIEGRPRRELVWALEALAWLPEAFVIAARLLRRLALGENETYANNATSCFVALFSAELGATSTAYAERLPILEEMLHEPPSTRRLLAGAVSVGLGFHGHVRFGAPPELPGRIIPEWRPKSPEERVAIIDALTSILAQLLVDRDASVRSEAAKVLSEATWGFVFARMTARWANLAAVLADAPFDDRKRVLDRTESLVRFHGEKITKEQREIIADVESKLSPSSFLDRLRLVLSRWPHERRKSGDFETRELSRLASEFLSSETVMVAATDWLVSGRAPSGWDFGCEVARQDGRRELLDLFNRLEPAAVRDDMFIAGYLWALGSSGSRAEAEFFLDRWAATPDRAILAASITHRIGSGGESAIARLTKLLESGAILAGFINRLTLGFFLRDESAQQVLRLINATMSDKSEDARRGRLHVLAQYVSHHHGPSEVVEALKAAVFDFVDASWNGMDEHMWLEAVDECFATGSMKRAELMFDTWKHKRLSRDDSSIGVLFGRMRDDLAALPTDARSTLWRERLAPTLAAEPSTGFLLNGRLNQGDLLDLFAVDQIVEWIAEDVDRRAWAVAHFAPVDGDPMPELARELLIRWGTRRDVTSALSASFGTGSWVGNMSDYYQRRLDTIRQWESDSAPQVVAFATRLRSRYEAQLAYERKVEEEEDAARR